MRRCRHEMPQTDTPAVHAAAILLDHSKTIKAPAWCSLISQSDPVFIAMQLVPVMAVDFYPRTRDDRAATDDGELDEVRPAGIAAVRGRSGQVVREGGPVGACGPSGIAGCGNRAVDGGAPS